MYLYAAGVRLGSLEYVRVWISSWSHSCGCLSSLGNCFHRTWPSDFVQRSVVPQGQNNRLVLALLGGNISQKNRVSQRSPFKALQIQLKFQTGVPYHLKLVAELRLQLQKPKKDPGGNHYVINKWRGWRTDRHRSWYDTYHTGPDIWSIKGQPSDLPSESRTHVGSMAEIEDHGVGHETYPQLPRVSFCKAPVAPDGAHGK